MISLRMIKVALTLLACQALANSASAAPTNCPLIRKSLEDRKATIETRIAAVAGIILFRHDEKHNESGALTRRGRLHARSFGWALSNISVAEVVYYATNKPRVKETARLAFPDHEIRKTDFSANHDIPTKKEVSDWARKTLDNLSTESVVVAFVDSRIINQFEIKDAEFACGEGLLLLADEAGIFNCTARFFPEEWIHPKATLPPWVFTRNTDCARDAAAVRSGTN